MMRRRSIGWPILCLLVAQACTGDQRTPTEIAPDAAANFVAPLPGCPTPTAVDRQIVALVPVGKKIITVVDFDLIVIAYRLGQVSQAQQAMFQLWAKVLKGYYAGQLVGGLSAQTQANVLALGKAFYCSVGLDGSNLTLSPSPLGSNNIVAVVFPSTTTQTVVVPGHNSGVMIPANALIAPTTITIAAIPDTFPEFHGPLNTRLDQFPPYFQYTAVPESSIGSLVTIGTCVSDPNLPASRSHLAHNVGTGLEILPAGDASFLNCGALIGSAQQPSPFELVQAHDYRGALSRVGSMIGGLFVTDAYAGSLTGIGGKTKSFSPFGVVDTLVGVTANSPTTQQAPTGSPVASPPSVLVQTLGAHTPLSSVIVVDTITQGTGLLTSGAMSGAKVTGTTTNAGTFTVDSWSLSQGANSDSVTATYPVPASGVGVSVQGNPVVFTATGGNDVIPYLSPNYQYLLAGSGDSVSFFSAAFTDTISWHRGPAGFGSGSVSGQSCPLDATVATLWNNANPPTAFLLRKTFQWITQANVDLQLGVAIDNDVQVYVNGTDITPTVQGGATLDGGYIDHEGCAAQDSYIFPVPQSLLHAGTNLVAIRARDRGSVAYIDARLSVASAPVLLNRITTPIRAKAHPLQGPAILPAAPARTTPRLRTKP